MPTTLYLTGATPSASRGTNTNGQAGTAKNWRAYFANTNTGNVTATSTVTTAGATSGIEVGAPALEWISAPLAAAGTVSGTVTFNIVAHESANNANATIAVRIDRLDSTCAIASTAVTSSFGTEVSTSAAARSWTATPTSTTFAKGDRIRIVPYFDDATGVTMGSGQTLTLTYGGTASTTQSYVTFNENLTFTDGMWEQRATTTTNALQSIARSEAEDLWVAVGNTGTIITSPDAVTWTTRTSGTTAALFAVARSESEDLWVAVGASGTVLTSPDGTTWTSRTSNTTNQLNDVARSEADDLWVAVGNTGTIITSPDGTTWTVQSSGVTNNLNGVGRSDGSDLWVVVGTGGAIRSSSDAVTWTGRTSGSTNSLTCVTYASAHGLWIVGGIGRIILTSPDGSTWTSRADTSGSTWTDVSCAGSTCVVVGSYEVAVTTDGTAYTQGFVQPGIGSTEGIAYSDNEDLWVACSQQGFINVTSHDLYGFASPQRLFPTDTASDISDQGTVEKELWTSRGSG